MKLVKIGSWDHPCQPWLQLHPDVSRRLFPGLAEAGRSVLEGRARILDSWKPPAGFAALVERVSREQGVAAGERLRRVGAGEPVVLTGQQPSYGGGPMFLWLKAISAIRHAERASQILGRPVQALFWIAGDDSDLAEVRGLSDPSLRRGFDSHGSDFPASRLPVGTIPFPREHRKKQRDEIHAAWPKSTLPSLLNSSDDLSSLLASCLRQWFGDRILIVDAGWHETRSAAATLYREFARNPAGIHADLSAGMERARTAGLSVSLRSWPDRLRLFHWSAQGRVRITRLENGWTDGSTNWSEAELSDALRDRPGEFSHDVVSRPFAAETIFPVLAHVLGPGEFAYFACLGPLSSRLGRTLAPALPRASGTILPKGPWPLAKEVGWDPIRTPPGPIQAMQDLLLDKRMPGAGLWPKLWSDARADYLDMLSEGKDLQELGSLSRQLIRFEAKWRKSLIRQSASQHQADLDSLRHLAVLCGQGGLQERLWSPFGLEHHLRAPRLLDELAGIVDPLDTVHSIWEQR